ncbi:PREDICTED: contactin-associated protein-like 2 [Branchiostoma belcheri]|uniref:Contactin-associated protein-like 2 n=1 Tax=Branchiostoma belcheri TaxID=7741 RepID=A0A6P4ZZ75_BRABE|nr:PREDICTED: contactin-associated protein-like 2 [Branchiostoma belcheri]
MSYSMNLLVSLAVFCTAAHVSCGQSTQEVSARCDYSRGGQAAYTFVLPPSSVHNCGSGSDQEGVSQLRDMVQQLQTNAQQQETKVQQLETKAQQLETKAQQQETEVQRLLTKVQVLETKSLEDKCAEGHKFPGVPSCYHLWKLGCRQSGSYVVSSNVSDVYCDFKNLTLPPGEMPRSCSTLYERGMVSGDYMIDPDGPEAGVEPFSVYCDMDYVPGKGETVISHDSEARTPVTSHSAPGSYMRDVTYHASLDQIRALIYISESCRQFIKYECFQSLMNDANTDYAWWVTWDGRKADYWGGATPGSGMCACGVEGTCDKGQTKCNCDNNDTAWRGDEGFLTHKPDLPVTQLRFGDTASPFHLGFHRLGKLRCS